MRLPPGSVCGAAGSSQDVGAAEGRTYACAEPSLASGGGRWAVRPGRDKRAGLEGLSGLERFFFHSDASAPCSQPYEDSYDSDTTATRGCGGPAH